MPQPQWKRAKQVFQEALDKTGRERDRFIATACGDDVELRAQVDALLAAHEEAGDFMSSPTGAMKDAAARAAATLAVAVPSEAPGARVGSYKLLQVIGEGGFGVVYMAEQEHPIHRRVALKIIKLGMDTKEVIARFEAERQALAMMDHPNIAKVFDAGATESGRPYFVMELVKGVPITDYCDANHLSTRERLTLFAEVCKAVHHAHEKGIIHRDIKPSNVMVTLHDGAPVPKVIDFGVAKATNQRLTEKTLFTAYGEFVGTPAYMSPEQTELSGFEIDRRSDVYSLGALLYEMLTGTTPFEAHALRERGFVEMMRVIREEAPPTPSARLHTLGQRLIEVAGRRQIDPQALEKLVRGDLDWIVMKALEKDRRRRYGSAFEFLEDLARYSRHEPVSARRSTAGYRLRKFARRRRGPVLAAVGIAVAIVLGATLAGLGGWTANGGDVAPTRRLVLDRAGDYNKSVPTRDGRHLLRYNVERRGYELVTIGSGQTKVLTRDGPDPRSRYFFDHKLAPDGRSIAAVHLVNASGSGESRLGNDAAPELRLFPVGGRGDGRLVFRWPAKHHVQVFGWSPDQTRVWVFVIRPYQRPQNDVAFAAEIASVGVADGSIAVLKLLPGRTHTQTPSLSPDGRFITYSHTDAARSPQDIFLISADGSREVRVEHPADDSKPMFAPDGSGVVFQSNRKGGSLWFLPLADGRPAGEPRPVWSDVGPFGQISEFAENGSLFYFFATNGWEIYTASIDLTRGIVGAPEHIPPRLGGMNNAPAFSPDGRHLAHLRDSGRRLVVREVSTGIEREFPISDASLMVPALDLCPDGRTAIVSGSTPRAVVIRVNLDRGGAEPLAISPAAFGGTRAVCIGNGQEIVYAVRDPAAANRLVRQSLLTGAEMTVYRGPIGRDVVRSSDGSKIAFVALGEQARLLVTPSSGGEPVQVATSPIARIAGQARTEFQGIMWLPRGDGLLVARGGLTAAGASSDVTFWRVPVDGGAATEAGHMQLPPYEDGIYGAFNYSLDPQGAHIAFERHAGLVAQEWAIDNLLPFIRSGKSVVIPDLRR